MKKTLLLLLVLAFPFALQAADLANGERINRNCALCHGNYGQGATGRLSPRLAGLPEFYLRKAIKDYTDGIRINPTMMHTSGLGEMPESDIEDVVAYLSSLDIGKDARFDIVQRMPGNPASGKETYMDDCKVCHGKDGLGKKKKDSPPLSGQHSEYLFQSIKMFQGKARDHDNDPEDELFDDYTDVEILDMMAFTVTMDDSRVARGERFTPPRLAMAPRQQPKRVERKSRKTGGLRITDISQTVAQMELKPGVSREDAIDAMISKAVELNLRLVGRQDVSKELESRGVETPYLSIFQFCNPMDARTMIINNPIFASYMPCRISMVEDQQGKMWLMMLNLDMLIDSELMPQAVVDTAIKVNQQMLDVMVAGATGEF